MWIYIVEDDENIREIESYALHNSGYETLCFVTGEELYAAVEERVPDLILLDIMLPGEDGLEILKHLRNMSAARTVPIIMVTAKTSELDKVKGLDGGADDYITKPFGVMELISRVKALLRRAAVGTHKNELSYGSVTLEIDRHCVYVDSQPVSLTFKEFELLRYLLENQGIVLSRDRIMDRVWGFDYEGETRTVDMHIKTLRQKLLSGGSMIKTVRNVGYKIGD